MKRILISVVLVVALLGAETLCADDKFLGYFPDITDLDFFERGVTTVEEVVAALGEPVGSGGAVLPPDYRRRDILYYEQINIKNMQNQVTGSASYLQFDMEQSILGVLVLDGKFDGFLWYSNSGLVEGIAK